MEINPTNFRTVSYQYMRFKFLILLMIYVYCPTSNAAVVENSCKVTPYPEGTISSTTCTVTLDDSLLATADLNSEIVCHVDGHTRGISAYLLDDQIKIKLIKLDSTPSEVLNEVVRYKVLEMLGTFSAPYNIKSQVQYSVTINKKRLKLICLPKS